MENASENFNKLLISLYLRLCSYSYTFSDNKENDDEALNEGLYIQKKKGKEIKYCFSEILSILEEHKLLNYAHNLYSETLKDDKEAQEDSDLCLKDIMDLKENIKKERIDQLLTYLNFKPIDNKKRFEELLEIYPGCITELWDFFYEDEHNMKEHKQLYEFTKKASHYFTQGN